MKTLYVIASPRGARSKSIDLGNHAVQALGGDVVTVDLYREYVPFPTEQVIAYVYGFAQYDELSADDRKIVDAQRVFIDQLKSADHLVIAVPMWNFGMPAALKAWFDLVIKVNETFSMNDGNYQGLVKNIKKAIVVGARGGKYIGTPMAAYDALTGPIAGLLGFIGIGSKDFWLEGVNMMSKEDLASASDAVKAEISAYATA